MSTKTPAPAPAPEFPFNIWHIVEAAGEFLGDEWVVSGEHWGVTGHAEHLATNDIYTVDVDEWGALRLWAPRPRRESPLVEDFDLDPSDGLPTVAQAVANAILADSTTSA